MHAKPARQKRGPPEFAAPSRTGSFPAIVRLTRSQLLQDKLHGYARAPDDGLTEHHARIGNDQLFHRDSIAADKGASGIDQVDVSKRADFPFKELFHIDVGRPTKEGLVPHNGSHGGQFLPTCIMGQGNWPFEHGRL